MYDMVNVQMYNIVATGTSVLRPRWCISVYAPERLVVVVPVITTGV
jgi:hypothetical protein